MTAATPPTKQPPIFNLPNQLTTGRLVLGIILFVLIEYQLWISCIAIFALASFTDWLDGFIARKQGITSTLGRNLDPLVDKVVVCGAYIFLLTQAGSGLTPWMVVMVVSREFIITSLRSFLENKGANFGAEWLGKIKMVLQCVALFAIFLYLAQDDSDNNVYILVRDISIWAMLISTALSGLQYLWKAFALLKKEE